MILPQVETQDRRPAPVQIFLCRSKSTPEGCLRSEQTKIVLRYVKPVDHLGAVARKIQTNATRVGGWEILKQIALFLPRAEFGKFEPAGDSL